jgi:hypothetical protein
MTFAIHRRAALGLGAAALAGVAPAARAQT